MTDDRCAPVTYVSGDGGFADVLDVGEIWTFTCTTTHDEVGTIVNQAEFTGNSLRDGLAVAANAEGTVVTHGADLVVDLSHAGNFTRGQAGDFSIVARNSGDLPTSATEDVSVAATLPAGLTATGISGEGWNCDLTALACTRVAALAGGSALPPIALETKVADDAPNSVTATATIAGGLEADEGNNTDTDLAIVDPAESGPGPGPGPGADRVAPKLTKLKLTPARFRAGGKAATTISWTLSEPATVRFRVERRIKGKWKRSKGSFSAAGKTGKNKLKFSGRVQAKKLKPGRHRLIAVATDTAGNSSTAARKPFTVTRP